MRLDTQNQGLFTRETPNVIANHPIQIKYPGQKMGSIHATGAKISPLNARHKLMIRKDREVRRSARVPHSGKVVAR